MSKLFNFLYKIRQRNRPAQRSAPVAINELAIADESQNDDLMQGIAYFNLIALNLPTHDESMRSEHYCLQDVLLRYPEEVRFRQHVESDLGNENFKLFAAIWRVSRVAEQYQSIFVQEFLESIAGIWLFSGNTIFINGFNLELESDFFQLANEPGDHTEAVEKFKTQHSDLLTYWRVRSFVERALTFVDTGEKEVGQRQVSFCRLLEGNQENLHLFMDLAEAQLDVKLGQYQVAEQRLKSILYHLSTWDKSTATFELVKIFHTLNDLPQAAQYAAQYLIVSRDLPLRDYRQIVILGSILAQAGQPERVIECFEEQPTKSDIGVNDSQLMTSRLVLLARAYQQIGQAGQLQAALDELLQYPAEKQRDEINYTIIDLLASISRDFMMSQREQLAIKYMNACLERSRQRHLKNAELSALEIIGFAHNRLGQYLDAIPYYQQAVRLARDMQEKQSAMDDMLNLAATYQNIMFASIFYTNKTELEESIRCFEAVLPLFVEFQENEKRQQVQYILSMMIIVATTPELRQRYTSLLAGSQLRTLQFVDDEFVILRTIQGGMSTVYFAFNKRPPFSASVIKALKPEMTSDWKSKEQFKREAEIWLELGNHPNFVFLKAIREHAGQIYLFLEFVIGPESGEAELSHWIGTPLLNPENSLKFGIQICDALDYADTQFKERKFTFAHLDLKPTNVLITREGVAKVTDFGISRLSYPLFSQLQRSENAQTLESLALSGFNHVIGTLPYMSPEQCRYDGLLDIRSDIYSFGCLLYEMLVGDKLFKAFDSQTYVYLHTKVAPRLDKLDKLPQHDEFKKIIVRCCEKDKVNRYQNFAELGDALRALYANLTNKVFAPGKLVEQEADQLVNAGLMKLQLYQTQDAIILFDQALQKDPRCARALTHKAIALQRLRRLDEAVGCCEQALLLGTDQVQVFIIMGNIYTEQGEFEKAIKQFDRALILDENNAGCWNNRGNAFARSGNIAEAIRSHERALALNAEFLEARLGLCGDLFNSKDFVRFKEEFDQLKRIDPHHPGVQKLAKIRELFPE